MSQTPDTPIQEGHIPFSHPSLPPSTPCKTYYKLIGTLSTANPPVVILHGGPGAGHEYLLTFSKLWTLYKLPIIFYDQLGCGASTHLPETAGDESMWIESLFQSELDNLLDYFKLRRKDGVGYHILGQSWGGMLGAAFAARRPLGLRRLVLASGLASQELSIQGVRLRRNEMPPEEEKYKAALFEAEEKKEWEMEAYKEARIVYFRRFVKRGEPFPGEELLPAMKNLSEDPTVNRTMNGPSLFVREGSLQGWTVIPRLQQIMAPTLVYNGEYDTSHDIAQVPFFELIPRVRWITFANGGHMCHLEGGEAGLRDRVLKVVGEFLTQKGMNVD